MNLLLDFFKNRDLNLRTVTVFTHYKLEIFAYAICDIFVVKMSYHNKGIIIAV